MLISINELKEKFAINISGILHIGAHNCEELGAYNKYGLKNSQIIWVEANPKLVEQNLKVDKSRIIKNFICCDTDQGKTKLNISNNGQSSSILELGTHAKSYPSIKYIDFVEVNNSRIDTMYNEDKIPKNFANFLNIDIQGAELMALKGMGDLLNYFDYVYLEVNKDYVYKNCALVHEIDEYLSEYNYVRVETSWTNDQWGDSLYIRIKNNFDLDDFFKAKISNYKLLSSTYTLLEASASPVKNLEIIAGGDQSSRFTPKELLVKYKSSLS